MNETLVTVTGYVAQEPILRLTGSGTKVVGFRVATTERRYDNGLKDWRDGDTLFFGVSCWRSLGENVLASVHKGDPVVVQGRLRDGSWQKDGVTHFKVEIEASTVGHDLSRGVSRFAKSSLRTQREPLVEMSGDSGPPVDDPASQPDDEHGEGVPEPSHSAA